MIFLYLDEALSIQDAFWQALLHDDGAPIICIPTPLLANYMSPNFQVPLSHAILDQHTMY